MRVPRLEGYRFGRVVVDGEEHTRDLIVLPHRVVANWWRRDGHRLVLEDLDAVLPELPERLVVGTGAAGQMRPDPEALRQLRERGVEVEVLPTDRAVARYGELDPERTAAAHPHTCFGYRRARPSWPRWSWPPAAAPPGPGSRRWRPPIRSSSRARPS
jgi:hypothetical protein